MKRHFSDAVAFYFGERTVLQHPRLKRFGVDDDFQGELDCGPANGAENIGVVAAEAMEDILVHVAALGCVGFPTRFGEPVAKH